MKKVNVSSKRSTTNFSYKYVRNKQTNYIIKNDKVIFVQVCRAIFFQLSDCHIIIILYSTSDLS